MKLVTLNLPTIFVNYIQSMVEKGFYQSRSHAIREITAKYLDKMENSLDVLEEFKAGRAVKRMKILTSNMEVGHIERLGNLKGIITESRSELMRAALTDFIFNEVDRFSAPKVDKEFDSFIQTYSMNNGVKEFHELNLEGL